VLSIAARYVTRSEDAKDIYQEVFLNVYRGLKKFRFKSEFSTWLYRITTNVCLTHRSHSRKRSHVSIDSGNENSEDPHGAVEPRSSEEMPDERAMSAEIAERLESALEMLSGKQRLVFTLKHYQGYKLREIAGMMGCKEGTVKRYLFAAVRRLRKQLEELN
jgi:RNA polymerase sigma-70 factor (ECF subfamily)